MPTTRAFLNLAKRLETHGESYFRFITTPDIEPTNNLAEQAIRFVVTEQRIMQGTRSERGDEWCERIWTVMATCGRQGRPVFEYLESAVTAWFHGRSPRRRYRANKGAGRDNKLTEPSSPETPSPPGDGVITG